MTITYPAKSADPQAEYSVAVVMPTLLRPTIEKAIRSIYAQRVKGTIQILIGIDRDLYDGKPLLDRLIEERPDNVAVTVLDLGYSTFARNGGLYNVIGGGALRPILTLMAHSRYVAFLDDDNWWHQDHLPLLLEAIQGHDYAFSQRLYCSLEERIFGYDYVGLLRLDSPPRSLHPHLDPNILMVDKLKIQDDLLSFIKPVWDDGYGEDIQFNRKLSNHYCYAVVNHFSVFYRCGKDFDSSQFFIQYSDLLKDYTPTSPVIGIEPTPLHKAIFHRNLWKRSLGGSVVRDKILLLGINDEASLESIINWLFQDQKIVAVPTKFGWSWNGSLDPFPQIPPYLRQFIESGQLEFLSQNTTDFLNSQTSLMDFQRILWQFDDREFLTPTDLLNFYQQLFRKYVGAGIIHIKAIETCEEAASHIKLLKNSIHSNQEISSPTAYELLVKPFGHAPKTKWLVHRFLKGESVIYDIVGRAPSVTIPKIADLKIIPWQVENDLLALWRQHRPQIYGYVPEDDRVIAYWTDGVQTGNQPNKAIFVMREKLASVIEGLGLSNWHNFPLIFWIDDKLPPHTHPNVPNPSIHWLDGMALATLLIPSDNHAYKPLSGEDLIKAILILWGLLLYQQKDQQILAQHIHNQSLGLHLPSLCQPYLATLIQAWPEAIIVKSL